MLLSSLCELGKSPLTSFSLRPLLYTRRALNSMSLRLPLAPNTPWILSLEAVREKFVETLQTILKKLNSSPKSCFLRGCPEMSTHRETEDKLRSQFHLELALPCKGCWVFWWLRVHAMENVKSEHKAIFKT